MSFKLGYNTSKAMGSYNANRNKAISQTKPKLSYPKLGNSPARTNRVTAGMQSSANRQFNALNFSS